MFIKLKKLFIHHKTLSTTILVITSILLIFVLLCISTYIPKAESTDYTSNTVKANPYIVEKPLVSAHRAGLSLAPENTMAAFKNLFKNNNDFKIDILEFDLHITKDDQLILLHDDTLDRTSDCKEVYGIKNLRPENYTLNELSKFNLGYHFEDENGNYPYRNLQPNELADCRVTTLVEVLDYLAGVEDTLGYKLQYIIEIKNGGDLGTLAADKLYEVLSSRKILDRVIVGTFKGEVTKHFDAFYPDLHRSASILEVLDFYFSCMFNVDLSKKGIKYDVMQIPYKQFLLNLGKKSIIDYAHKYGIAVQYWTINNPKQIEHLTNIGADAIITDNPALAYKIINDIK